MPKKTTPQGKTPSKPRSRTISFRLDETMFSALEHRARLLKTSTHDLARYYAIEALHRSVELDAILDHLSQLEDDINKVRGDVVTAAEALMVASGHCTVEEARKWGSGVFT